MFTDPSARAITKSFLKASADISDIEWFKRGRDGDAFGFSVPVGESTATLFNLSVMTSAGVSGSGNLRYRVAKLTAAGLPRFYLGRRSLVNAVRNLVDKAVGTPEIAVELDSARFPVFAREYWLRATDAGQALSFLTDRKIRFLEEEKLPGILATNARYLCYFEQGSLETEADYNAFVATVTKMARMLL